jgi:hypothetical protein
LRHVAAVPAATTADVVRQFMTQPQSPRIRAVMQGNVGTGGVPLAPRAAFVVAASIAGRTTCIACSINRTPKHPSAEPRVESQIHEHLSDHAAAFPIKALLCKPHRRSRLSV